MYNIDFTFNLFTLFAITAAAGIIGYAFRSRQIQKKQMKVLKLRREVMNNHASILELQKECVDLQNQLRSSKIAISPLKSIVKNFDEEEVDHSPISKPDWNIRLDRKIK